MMRYLAAHETIPIARIDKTKEMNLEHGHIKSNRDHDETQHTCGEMFDPHFLALDQGIKLGVYRRHSEITEKIPQLQTSQTSNPSDGKEANPLHTDSGTESESRKRKPHPPVWGKHIVRQDGSSRRVSSRTSIVRPGAVVLGFEGGPSPCCKCSADDERRIEQDQTRLSDETVFKGD